MKNLEVRRLKGYKVAETNFYVYRHSSFPARVSFLSKKTHRQAEKRKFNCQKNMSGGKKMTINGKKVTIFVPLEKPL